MQLDSIGLCQAARQAIIVPPRDRIAALNVVSGWSYKVTAATDADPEDSNYIPLLSYVRTDLQNLNGDWLIYNSLPTPDHWNAVVNDLINLGTDSEISTGG